MDRNELDPSVPSATEVKKIPLIIKVYAVLCILSGVGTLPSVGAFMWQVITALINGNAAAKLGNNTLVAVGLIVAGIMLSAASAVILIIFGLDLIKNQRRNAARLSYILIAFAVVELLVDVMLQGIGPFLLRPAIQLGILVALSATVDPTLRQERELQRRLQEMLDRDAAAEGMLGRDETGEGYIKLNYFNLFWVFFVCTRVRLKGTLQLLQFKVGLLGDLRHRRRGIVRHLNVVVKLSRLQLRQVSVGLLGEHGEH